MMEDIDEEEVNFDQAGLLDNRKKPSPFSSWFQNIVKILCLSLAFLSLGLCIAVPGPTLLDLQDQIHADTSRLTLIFSARSVGYLLGAFFGGFLFDIFNKLLLLCVTLFLASIATVIIPWSLTLAVLAVMFSIQGLSMGVLDTGGNSFCVKIWGKRSSPYMQFMHFAFGIGAFIAPILSQPFLSQDKPLTVANIQGNVPVVIGGSLFDNSLPSNITHMRKRDVPSLNISSDILDGNLTSLYGKTNDTNTTETSTLILPVLTIATTTLPKKPTSASDEHLSSLTEHYDGKILKDAVSTKQDAIDKAKKKGTVQNVKDSPPKMPNLDTGGNNTEILNDTFQDNGTDSELLTVSQTVELSTTITTTTTQPTTTSTTATTSTSTTTTTKPTTAKLLSTAAVKSSIKTDTAEEVHHVSIHGNDINKPGSPKKETNSGSENSAGHALDTSGKVDNDEETTNATHITKPKSVHDFISSAVEAVKHMSRIQFSYMIISVFLLLNAVIFLVLYCCDKRATNEMDEILTDRRKMYYVDSTCIRVMILLVMFLFFFAYIGIETTFGGLVMTFTVDYMHWTKKQGTIVTSIFWGSLAAGRGFSVFIAGCCKPRTMLIIDLFFMTLGSSLLSFAVHQSEYILWAGTLCLGLGMSSVFPTGLSWTEQYFHMTGKSTAVLVTGSALGQMVIPVATGYVFEKFSQMYLMYVVLILTIACVILYTVMQVLASKCGRRGHHLPSSNGFLPLNTQEEDHYELDGYGTTSSDSTHHRQKTTRKQKHSHGDQEYDLIPLDNGNY